MTLLRHALAVAVCPFTVAVLVPLWLARREGLMPALAGSAAGLAMQAGGLAVAAVGLALFVTSLRRFATEGRGTLAPWDPPRAIAAGGQLVGEALVLRSRPHLLWACTFFAINAVYIPLLEEPDLARRFGDSYREYCRHVPRLLPRLRPWHQT